MKERIIGAAVLVVVVVLVVPVFLDGPPADGEIVSEHVPLPGQSGQETKTVVLDRDRSDPVPSNGGSQPAEATPEPVVTKPAPEPEPVAERPAPRPVVEESREQPAVAESSTTGMWAVQLGSFGNQQNAERLAAELRKQGHAAFLSQVQAASGQLHRVRVGPQADRASADAVAAELKKAGHDVKVLPHP